MSMVSRIIAELRTPDAQWGDWYLWCCNQGSHAFLGTLVAYAAYPGDEVLTALICGALKEFIDLARNPIDRAALIDSAADVAFWGLGAWIAATQGDMVAVALMAFALICGVVPRLRRLDG